jgi:hypothetical protein
LASSQVNSWTPVFPFTSSTRKSTSNATPRAISKTFGFTALKNTRTEAIHLSSGSCSWWLEDAWTWGRRGGRTWIGSVWSFGSFLISITDYVW